MVKTTITKTWIAGLIVLGGGLILGGVNLGLMLAMGGRFAPAPSGNGYDFVPTLNAFFWTTLSLMIAGFLIAAAGGIVQLTAWIGALVNTYQLADKTWFVALLAGGLLGLAFALVGCAAMVAYVIAGPDGMALQRQQPPAPTPQATTLAATS